MNTTTKITHRCMGCGKKVSMEVKPRHVDFYNRVRFMCDKCTEEVMSMHAKRDEERTSV